MKSKKSFVTSDSIKVTSDPRSTIGSIGGISAKVMASVEGEKVMIKGDENVEAYSEYIAFQLGSFLGLNVNKVILTDCGDLLSLDSKLCSVHFWEEGFLTCSQYKTKNEIKGEEFKLRFKDDIEAMRLFDLIIENEDRHTGNYGILNNRIFLIDNGLARPWYDFSYKSRYDKTNTTYGYSFEKFFEERIQLDLIKKFATLTNYRIDSLLKLPENIKAPAIVEHKILEVRNRFREIRKYFRQELKRMGVAYK